MIASSFFAGATMAARAEDGGRFLLDAAACSAVSEASIRRLVAIEVGDLLRDAGASEHLDRLTIRCDGGAAHVTAKAASSSRTIARDLSLAEFPGDAAPRALALAGLETLAALSPVVRARLETRQAAAPPRPIVTASPPAPSTRPGRSFRLDASFVRRVFLSSTGVHAWGGRVGFGRAVGGGPWDLGFDVEIDRTETAVARGEVSALLASLGAFAGLRLGSGPWLGILSMGARAGVVRLAGTPETGSPLLGAAVLRPWAGPAVRAQAVARLGPVGLTFFGEGGFAARGAEGQVEGTTVLAASGAWITAGAGVVY